MTIREQLVDNLTEVDHLYSRLYDMTYTEPSVVTHDNPGCVVIRNLVSPHVYRITKYHCDILCATKHKYNLAHFTGLTSPHDMCIDTLITEILHNKGTGL